MELIYIRLPKWKCYLYSLLERIKLYKAINSNRYRWNLNRSEVLLLRQMQSKYLSKGVMRKPKSFGYVSLLQSVLIENITAATKDEIELAQKFLIVNKLKLEELIMEMKDLKKFAKEVGIKDSEVKKMDESTLTKEIITRVEPQQEYSKELVAFYNDLPDNFFDEAEATGGAEVAETNSNGEGSYSIDDVVEVINEYTKVTELKEILADEDVGAMFEGFDPSAYKLAPKLKKAMIEFLTNPPSAAEETNGDNADAIAVILEMTEESELVSTFEELQESHFAEIDAEAIEDTDQLKAAMLDALGYEPEPEPEVKKKSLLGLKKSKPAGKAKLTVKAEEDEFDWFDPKGDMEEMYAQIEQLPMAKAKKFAKAKLQLSLKIGMTKEKVLDSIATKLQEMAEGGVTTSTESEETELTPELVAAAVKAKDKEALASICDQLGIKLNALQKKSIGGMEKKIKEQMGDAKPKETTKPVQKKLALGKKKEEVVSEEKSVYQLMEELVIAGKSEDAVTKAVSPYYKEKGKSILFIKKRVKTMVSIIKIDNDMEE